MKPRFSIALTIVGLLPFSPARAAGDAKGVIFDANVAAACTLTVNSNGTMVPSAGLETLSSKLAGGSPASLSLATTGGVDLSVDPVTVVTVPVDDVTTTTWTPTYSASGAHTVSETGATSALAAAGASTVSVNLVGTKGGSDRFSRGSYQATVTVRCE